MGTGIFEGDQGGTFSPPPIPEARILVVDDELHVRSSLERSLTAVGYRVDEADSGPAALEMLERTPYDLMVLDLRMPGMDGVEVMERTCEIFPDLLIIVLTGHAAVENAIAAVKCHAVDFLEKPISVRAVADAVARALEWRIERDDGEAHAPQADRFLAVGPLSLDREKRLVVVARPGDAPSIKAELTPSEVALLTQLMEHPESVFNCRELARTLHYDVSEMEARSLVRPHICRLRRKIESDPSDPRLIRTKVGGGYFFTP